MSPDSSPPTPSTALPATERGWVWHSTLATKAAGKISVLAVVETVLACVGYWWFAFHFDTHWHLLTSIVIAPLLLLRSPESIKLGVKWFLAETFENWAKWPRARRRAWRAIFAITGGGAAYCVCAPLAQEWLPGTSGWALFGKSAALGVLGMFLAFAGAVATAVGIAGGVGLPFALAAAGAVAFSGAGSVASAVVGAFAGTCAGSCAGAVVAAGAVGIAFSRFRDRPGAIAVAVSGAGAGAYLIVVAFTDAFAAAGAIAAAVVAAAASSFAVEATAMLPGTAAGFLLRSLACRIAATIRRFWRGWCYLPANWRENNLLTDSSLPPELMPGIREHESFFALDGLVARGGKITTVFDLMFLPQFAVPMFLPAVFYRLGIKATAWFWWPLAMLLKSVPQEDVESGEKDRLTWPWRNPFQKALIILSIGIALITLPGHFLNTEELMRSLLPSGGKVEGVPFLVRVAQALGWDGIRPWHWAVAFMAACSVGMLIIGGRAVQKDENGHWPAYRKSGLRRDLWCMDMLKRVRFLATLFFWGTGLLALLLETKAIPEKIPLPPRQTEALREWFAGDAAGKKVNNPAP